MEGPFHEDRLRYTRPTGHGTRRYLKGCRLKGRSPVGDVVVVSAAKEAGPDFFSRTSVRAQEQSLSTSPVEEGSTQERASAIDCEGPPPADGSLR